MDSSKAEDTTKNKELNVALAINTLMIPLSIALTFLTVFDIHTRFTIFIALIVFCFGPGSGLIAFLRLKDFSTQLGLIISTSLSISMLISQVLLSIGVLSESAAMLIITGITCMRPIKHTDNPSDSENGSDTKNSSNVETSLGADQEDTIS